MTTSAMRDCFERALALEGILRDFYRKAALEFSHEESVFRFLQALAADESCHIAALEAARSRTEDPLFDAPDMRDLLSRIEVLDARLRGETSKPYADFNELYLRITALETSEINNIFEILTTGILKDPGDSGPMRDLIKDHILRVTDLGKRLDRSARLKMLSRPLPRGPAD